MRYLLLIILRSLFLASLTTGLALAEPVKIGVVLPLTGGAADFGLHVRDGIELAKETFKGVSSRGESRIQLVYQDSKCSPREAVTAFHTFKRQGIKFIIGAGCSSCTLAIAPLAEKNRILLITPVSSASTISEAGDFVFRNHTRVNLEFEILAKWAAKRYRHIGFLYDSTNDATEQAAKYFMEAFPGKVTAIPFEGTKGDYRAEVLKVKQANVDAVHLEALVADLVTLLKNLEQIGLKKPILSDKMAGTTEFLEAAGHLSEGVVYPIALYKRETNPGFWGMYRSKRGKDPNIFVAQGYDTLLLLTQAVRNCGLDSECVRDYLYGVKDYRGAAGLTSFDKNGDAIREIVLMQVRKGKFKQLK